MSKQILTKNLFVQYVCGQKKGTPITVDRDKAGNWENISLFKLPQGEALDPLPLDPVCSYQQSFKCRIKSQRHNKYLGFREKGGLLTTLTLNDKVSCVKEYFLVFFFFNFFRKYAVVFVEKSNSVWEFIPNKDKTAYVVRSQVDDNLFLHADQTDGFLLKISNQAHPIGWQVLGDRNHCAIQNSQTQLFIGAESFALKGNRMQWSDWESMKLEIVKDEN